MIVCTACGSDNAPDDDFCGACGAYLKWDDQPAVASEPPAEQTVVDRPPPESSPASPSDRDGTTSPEPPLDAEVAANPVPAEAATTEPTSVPRPSTAPRSSGRRRPAAAGDDRPADRESEPDKPPATESTEVIEPAEAGEPFEDAEDAEAEAVKAAEPSEDAIATLVSPVGRQRATKPSAARPDSPDNDAPAPKRRTPTTARRAPPPRRRSPTPPAPWRRRPAHHRSDCPGPGPRPACGHR